MQSWLVVGTKLSGVFLSGLMPLALAARRNVTPEFVRAWDASWEQAELASLFCLVLLTLCPSLVSASAVRDAGTAYLLISLALVVAPASGLIEATLPFLFLACHVCLFIMTSHAASVALRTGRPLARARLLGTVVAQLLHVVFLAVPSIATLPIVLFSLALVCTVLTTAGAQDEDEKKKNDEKTVSPAAAAAAAAKNDKGKEELDDGPSEAERAKQEEEKKKADQSRGARVTLGVAAAFLLVAAVGLNGEQILDASFKLAGRRGPLLLTHLVTAGARLVAWRADFHFSVLGALWAATQFVRLFFLGAKAELLVSENLWQIGALVALDKWAGSVGEIALESALLSFLQKNSQNSANDSGGNRERWLVPAVALLALLQPLEDVTGVAVRMAVRAGAIPLQYGAVVGLVLFTLVAILRQARKEKQS